MIRDIFMGTGSFNIPLRADTPRSVRIALGKWDTIVVTPGRAGGTESGAPQMTLATMLTNALFTGRVLSRKRGKAPGASAAPTGGYLAGDSIVGWLGDAQGKGNFINSTPGVAATLGVRLLDYFAGGGTPGAYTNGILLGTTTGISTNTISDDSIQNTAPRVTLDRWCKMTDTRTEWRITPAGSMSFRPAGTYDIYAGDAAGSYQVVVAEGLGGEIRGDTISVPVGSLDPLEDFSEYASIVHCYNGSTDYTTTGPGGEYSFDGASNAYMEASITAPTAGPPSASDLQNLVDNAAVDNFVDRYSYNLTVDPEFMLATWLGPGARFYIYDPDAGQTDVSNRFIINGQQVHPTLVRCTGLTYPLTPRHGVYGWTTYGGTSTMVDLSPWVDHDAEPKTTTIDVGSRPITLTRSIRNGIL